MTTFGTSLTQLSALDDVLSALFSVLIIYLTLVIIDNGQIRALSLAISNSENFTFLSFFKRFVLPLFDAHGSILQVLPGLGTDFSRLWLRLQVRILALGLGLAQSSHPTRIKRSWRLGCSFSLCLFLLLFGLLLFLFLALFLCELSEFGFVALYDAVISLLLPVDRAGVRALDATMGASKGIGSILVPAGA